MSTDPVTGSPLDTAETSFRLLTTGPGALSLDCTAFAPALPRGEVNLAELRMLLTSRHVSDETRDAVWRELVTRARVGKGAWTVAAVGMAMPALRVIAAALTRDLPYGDPTDVDSEVLSGYLRALRRLDLDTTDVRARLCQAARCAGERAVRHIVSNAKRRQPPEESPPRQRPQPCPELVLADSVALGVLSEQDAELILLTRLGGMPLRQPPGATPPPLLPQPMRKRPRLPRGVRELRMQQPQPTRREAGTLPLAPRGFPPVPSLPPLAAPPRPLAAGMCCRTAGCGSGRHGSVSASCRCWPARCRSLPPRRPAPWPRRSSPLRRT